MPLEITDKENQDKLKHLLQSESKSSKLEHLAVALVGKILGVPIAVAKSGFQHGGDAGPAGRQGRRFRLECKKYSDTTSLSDRELLGEIDQALSRDPALEAWFLVATRNVPEQLEQALFQKGEREGIPIVIFDWKSNGLASLAALCAVDPDLVEAEFSKDAGNYARALQSVAADAIDSLRRDMQSWCLGFESLRTRSHERVRNIWNSPRTSQTELGQNAAGGAQSKRIQRATPCDALEKWWDNTANADSPAAVFGWEGVGKTWSILDWMIDHLDNQPIVLIVPSSSAAILTSVSETRIKQFLAERLYELSGVRSATHWLRRLEYLLKRPATEGPVLTIFLDGLNQEASIPWLQLLKTLQGECFSGKVRVIVSTRKHHFEDKLASLRGLLVPAQAIEIGVYDNAAGGELDQILAFEGLTRADLHPDLIELARTPRLFSLVIKFRDRLVEAGQVTVHRLLWEYGRDTLGTRAGNSFSENEWQDWLKEIAQEYRNGFKEYTVKSLGESISRPDLAEKEVYTRLSDIIDGRFAVHSTTGRYQFAPTIISHALGVALLTYLDSGTESNFEELHSKLEQWLDPISGLDERAEILRASVSVLVEQKSRPRLLAGLLVTSWLQTQNISDAHRKELAALAPDLVSALLDAIEQSESHTHASARLWSMNALRSIPRDNQAAAAEIFSRITKWFSIVSRDVSPQHGSHEDFEKKRAERFMRRIGTDSSGKIMVCGIDLELNELNHGTLQMVAPSIMEGFPLAMAISVFTTAAATLAIRDRCEGWDGLKWLCLLNEIDPDVTASALQAHAASLRLYKPETGVHPNLSVRIAALLLYLTGQEQDEDEAANIDPHIDQWWSYEKDYLSNPARSLFALERRHAEIALNDNSTRLVYRIQRTKELWLDPGFKPPESFAVELREAARLLDVSKLNRQGHYTVEDHDFEEIECALARCAPELLAALMRKKLQEAASCPSESRYWCSLHVVDHLLLAGPDEAKAVKQLRLSCTDADKKNEAFVSNRLMAVDLLGLDVQTQFNTVISADLKYIFDDFSEILSTPGSDDVDTLISTYANGTAKQKSDLLLLLSIHPIDFSETAWSWIFDYAKQPEHEFSDVAFRTLALSNAMRLGKMLTAENWNWGADKHDWINHYGTGALIEATQAIPFEQVAPRLAPWRVLEAARLRGDNPAEVRLATEIIGHLLLTPNISTPDPGAELTVDREKTNSWPFSFSAEPRTTQPQEDIREYFAGLDADTQLKAHQLASETAYSRIKEARASGAKLYLANLAAADFESALKHAPELVHSWLDGYKEHSADFRRRVLSAENAFFSICEALLAQDPYRGIGLWRALREISTIRYLGEASVEDLLLMVFRVPDSLEINKLREELLEPVHSPTDQALLNLALAATINGKSEWLKNMIEADKNSALAWKRKRGEVLSGFTANNALPITNAWPDGEIKTSHESLKKRSARFRWIEACAHHWWKTFLDADTPDKAYAAWILFLQSADRRTRIWIQQETLPDSANNFSKVKLSHVRLNHNKLKRAMEKREEKFDKELFNRDTYTGIGPWPGESS